MECLRCLRSYYKQAGMKVPGHDMTVSEFEKIIKKFDTVRFCGNISDPVFNPNFITFLEMCYEKNIKCKIHHAATGKSLQWYEKAFKANPNAIWIFGIDGLPKDSSIYRKNQDGEKLFDIMLLCNDMGLHSAWLYIIFRYNENTMDEARQLARKHNIELHFVKSSRYEENDDLMPKNKENYIQR